MNRPRTPLAPLFLLLGALTASCASKPSPPPVVGLSTPKAASSAAQARQHKTAALPAVAVAKLVDGTMGPYVAAHEDHALVVYAAPPAPGQSPSWHAVACGPDGAPRAAPKLVAPAGDGLVSVSLRAGRGGGFTLVWGRRGPSGHVVQALALDATGAARGQAAVVYEAAEPVSWADVVASNDGDHVFFAVPIAGRVRLLLAATGPSGEARGAAQVVAEGATAWQIAPSPQGSMLLVVKPSSPGKPTGQLVAHAVDRQGRPGAAHVIEARDVVDVDLDAVALGDRVAVAWTDRSGTATGSGGAAEGLVRVAMLDATGRVMAPPSSPLRSAGEHALVGLAASTGPEPSLLVAWDDLALRATSGRKVRLTSLGPDGRDRGASATLSVGVREEASPLLVGAPGGFALLTLARACRADEASCTDAPVWPTVVRFSDDLDVQASSPLALEPLGGEPPQAAWGLACTSAACLALAGAGGNDTGQQAAALLARIEPATSVFRPVVERDPPGSPPAGGRIDSMASGPRLADLATVSLATSSLVATVTLHTDGAPPPPLPRDVDARAEADKDRARAKDAHRAPARGAIVTVHALDARGALTRSNTLTVRALSSPGVAAVADVERKGACVAWSARDGGDPQVFLTLVDADGKRKAQQMLTTAKGDVADLALLAVDDGYLVVWVDGRDGNGEVYAARVDRQLRRKSPDARITNAPGDATDLDVVALSKTEALVAFSDARSSPADGLGDVHVAKLKLADATRVGDETRLAATPEHARAVRLARTDPGGDVVVGWVELPPPSQLGDRKPALHLLSLTPDGAPRSLPQALALPGQGPVSSLAMACSRDGCRVVVGQPDGEGLGLFGFAWRPGQLDAAPRRLASLFSSATTDVTPAMLGDAIVVADEGASGEGRLRRVQVRW